MSPGPKPTTLTFGITFAPTSLDPAKSVFEAYSAARALSNEPIIELEPDGSYGPALATSWHYVGTGNRAFEFTLRHNARFSDGTPVTAAAVKTWLEYFAHANGPLVGNMGPIKSIDTIGQWTVTIHLAAPNPIMPFVLSQADNWGSVSSPKAVAHPATLTTETDGAGPYKLSPSQTTSGSQYTFVPNPYYYDKAAIKFRSVTVKVISNASTMLQAAESGQLDVAFGDPTTADAASHAGLQLVSEPVGFDGLLILDRAGRTVKALGDVRVRQALNYAINRSAITKALIGRWGTPSSEPVWNDVFDPKYQDYYTYNPAKAKALLAAAGYPHGFSFSAGDQGFFGTYGDPVVQAMAQELSAVGVKMHVTAINTNAQYGQEVTSGKFPATGLYANPPGQVSLAYVLLFAPGAGLNLFKADDPVLDALNAKGRGAANPGPIWTEMADRMTTQADFVPVFASENVYYVSPHIGGVKFSLRSLYPYATAWYPK